MKLSEKGKEKLTALGFAFNCDQAFDLLDDYEFEPEDFEGAVIMTIDEAEEIKLRLDVSADDWLMYSFLDELIEEAKGKNK